MPSTSPTAATGERAPAPRLGLDALARIAAERFGVAGEARDLPSSIDRNARIDAADGTAWVLKVASADEPAAHVELQLDALARLAGALPGRVPAPRPPRGGAGPVAVVADDGRPHLAWMTSLLPGTLLADAARIGPGTWRGLGALLAEVQAALAGLEHPALVRPFRWSPAQAAWTIARAGELFDGARRALVQRAQLRWLAHVHRELGALPAAVLHNDANPRNVVVDEAGGEARVTGIFDLGDLARGPRVCELAVAGAYAAFDAADPFAPLAALARGYDAAADEPLGERELAALPPATAMRLVTSVTIATLDARVDPDNAYLTADRDAAWDALARLDAVAPADAVARLRAGLDRPAPGAGRPLPRDAVLAKRERHFAGALSLAYAEPLELVRGRGAYLFDKRGEAYLDAVNNVCHVGHAHPRVVAAAAAQMAELNTNTRYLHDLAVEYAERLAALFPGPLEVVFLVNSGSEANELALRLARAATGRRDMLVVEHGYHGNTSALVDLSHYKHAGPGGAGTPDWVHVAPCPDPYRRPDEDGAAPGVAAALASAAAAGREVAGMLVEPLIGCGGQVVPPAGWLRSAFAHVRAAGGVCIADEVQVGFGRVGTHWWAFEEQGALPDVVTLGKPIGNGHPLAAVVTTRAIADALDRGMEWFNTFGGNPVSCAVGLAVLDAIEDEGLRARAREVGARLLEGFRALASRDAGVRDARGRGMYLGLELVRDRATRAPDAARLRAVIEACRATGVLLSADGPHHDVLKVKPPLAFGMEEAELLLATLEHALAETRA